MAYVVKLDQAPIEITFSISDKKQPMLFDALLKYSELSFADLAFVLNIPIKQLENMHRGSTFLDDENANNLAIAFFTFFSGDELAIQ